MKFSMFEGFLICFFQLSYQIIDNVDIAIFMKTDHRNVSISTFKTLFCNIPRSKHTHIIRCPNYQSHIIYLI